MEKLDLSKLKRASSSLGELIKTGGAQMGRTISSKMKEILQTPTPESRIVDEATGESMEGPDWSLNLRICSTVSRGEYDVVEIVRSIKRKLAPGRNPAEQGLTLDLLESFGSNCDKVFPAAASEKLPEDMVSLIEDSRTEHGIRVKAMQLIRAWGESDELEYLPVFNQTYLHLMSKEIPQAAQEEDFPETLYNLESYLAQQQESSPRRHPIPGIVKNEEDDILIGHGFQSTEEKKEILVLARNSLDVLTSILNSRTESKPVEDELTTSLVEKCKEYVPAVRRIIESSDDEDMLFEALNLHDELQQVISRPWT